MRCTLPKGRPCWFNWARSLDPKDQPPPNLRPSARLQHMDSPIISRLFRQLFTHRPCQALRSHSALPFRIQNARRTQVRCFAARRGGPADKNESNWQQRTDLFPQDMSEEYNKYPMVTADHLRGRRERPRRVKMLTRDFIEGMLTQSREATCTDPGQTHCIILLMDTFRSKL